MLSPVSRQTEEPAPEVCLAQLRRYVESRDFAGFDPYDALCSPLLRGLSFGSKAGRIAWTQCLRRLPVNLRPILGIRPQLNAKGLGLFLEGYIRLAIHGDAEAHRTVERLIGLLAGLRRTTEHGAGWGYPFIWQSRAFMLPAGTPTVVNTAFVGHALLDAWERLGLETARQLVLPCRDFILRDLNRIEGPGDSFAFSYTPLDRYAVHNASLLGASLLIRLAAPLGDTDAVAAAERALAYSLAYQRPDGSWFYAERPGSHWIDSFHTGFNLEAIRRFLAVPGHDAARDAYARGVRFYAKRFFAADGRPAYYHDRMYPLDIHAPAEAIAFFAGEGADYQPLRRRVSAWMRANMRDATGYFYYRRGRVWPNRIPYMRWAQAWAFRALTCEVGV